jgi:hypothetical protein
MGSAAYEPALKKARTFSGTPISVDVNGYSNGNGVGAQDQANGDLECRRFSTPEGCPYGTKCRFKHGPAGSILLTIMALMQFPNIEPGLSMDWTVIISVANFFGVEFC